MKPLQSFYRENVLKFLVIALIIAMSAWGIYFAIGLFGDGIPSLFFILRSNNFSDWDKARLFANWLTQLPIILALKFGVHDINLLIRIHSFGLVSIPSFFWIWAMLIHWKSDRFWYFLFAFSVSYLNSAFQFLGEYNVCYSMVALSTSILLKNSRLKSVDCLVLLFLAISLTRSYESMAFLGVLLYCIAIGRCFQSKSISLPDSSFAKIILLVSGFFYAMGTAIGTWFIVYPRSAERLANASDISPALSSWSCIYSLFIMFIYLFSSVSKNIYVRKVTLCLGAIVSIAYLSNPSYWNPFWLYYSFRVIAGAGLFLVLFFVAIRFFCFEPYQKDEKTQNSIHLISFLFFLSLSIPFFSQIRGLGYWFKQFEFEVNSRTGLIPWETSGVASSNLNKGYIWPHSNSALSILLRQDRTKAIILAPDGHMGWQPFDPKVEILELPSQLTKNGTLFSD